MRARHLVGVFAHPDDEAYAAGGLLALAARGGARVTVVCATRGEAGVLRAPTGDEPDAGSLRLRELERSCRALGVRPPRLLDLPDGAVAEEEARAVRALAEALGEERPGVLVTLGEDGAYGHRDHLALTRALHAAVPELPAPAPRVLHAAFPPGLFLPVWRRLRRLRQSPIAPEVRGADLGCEPNRVDLEVPVGPVREAKLASLAAHRSQLTGGDPRSFLAPGLVEPLLEVERFTLASGPPLPPGATDPFAGLP